MKHFEGMLVLYLTLVSVPVFVNCITFEDDVTLTARQKELLDKFKSRVVKSLPHDYMKKEIYLVKWLRSSNFNTELAESRLWKNLEWRKENRMDTINDEDWSDLWSQGLRYYLDGRDKLGRSFVFFDLGNIDLRKLILQGKSKRLLRYADKAIEDACTLVRQMGEQHGNITRGHLLMNLNNYNTVQHGCLNCVPFLLRILFSYLDHWPECVAKVIGVNAPKSVEQMVNIAKPFLDPVLQQSIYMYGNDKKVWRAALEEDFDFGELPPVLGGSKMYKGMEEEDNNDDNV